ncbi:hypothetical protein B6S59_17330 [Pseudomonas sp. A46]|nr:hypothetical protein B6S59_17330 [Pseudomonas sp. A46]
MLTTLDRQLNDIYNQTLTVTSDKGELRQEQRQWLHSVRDPCSDSNCLVKAYQHRVAELSERFIIAAPITDRLLSNEEARQACEAIADLAGKESLVHLGIPGFRLLIGEPGDVPKQWSLSPQEQATFEGNRQAPEQTYLLRLTPDQQPERFVSYSGIGTCAAQPMINMRYAAKPEDAVELVPDPEDLVRWALWGGAQYPMLYNKRVFLIASDLPDPNAVKMVSWVTPDGRTRPLCMINPEPSRFSVASAEKPDLCERIADGRLPPLAWRDESGRLRSGDIEMRYGIWANSLGVLELDLDGDGRIEKVGRLKFDSGAGCGGESVWLTQLSDDLSSKTWTLLSNEHTKPERGSLNIYSSQGQYYISLRDTIVQLKSDQVVQVCEFNRMTPRKVSTFFDVAP